MYTCMYIHQASAFSKQGISSALDKNGIIIEALRFLQPIIAAIYNNDEDRSYDTALKNTMNHLNHAVLQEEECMI